MEGEGGGKGEQTSYNYMRESQRQGDLWEGR